MGDRIRMPDGGHPLQNLRVTCPLPSLRRRRQVPFQGLDLLLKEFQMETIEAEIAIDADVHSEIVNWAQGWDNTISRTVAEEMSEKVMEAHPDARTRLITEDLLQSQGGRRLEKVNRTILLVDYHVRKVVVSMNSQYHEENVLRREVEDELTGLFKGNADAYRVNTRMKVSSHREVLMAI